MTAFTGAQLRQSTNFVIFLGPAIILLAMFFVAPVFVDIFIAFTDMGRTLQITEFTTENFERMFSGDRRLSSTLALTFVYVLGTLAIFNVTFGLILALVTTAIPDKAGGFFRAVWLLPRMSPSVVYALLWAWVAGPTERGLMNQVLSGMLGLPPEPTRVDWTKIVFHALTIKGIYGREIFETWYKMIVLLQNGLDVRGVITHRFPAEDFANGFAAMRSGTSGKIVLDWTA